MAWLAVHGFVIAFWATVFWSSISLLDRGNAKNTFTLAVVLGVIFAFTHAFGIPDVFHLGVWLVFLVRLVMWHYGLSLLAALIAAAATVLGPYFVLPWIAILVGDNALADDLVVYGFPLAVFGTWLVMAARKRSQVRKLATEDAGSLPSARVARGSRKRSARQPEAAATPVVAAPIAAAPEPVTPRRDGGPTFLT